MPLLSERDQNFRLTTGEGRRYVFKIANPAESGHSTQLQVDALLHLEKRRCAVATPRVIHTVDGRSTTRIGTGSTASLCRVVSYLEGRTLESQNISPALAVDVGRSAAKLTQCLADFEHPGDSHPILWDLQRTPELRELLVYIDKDDLRDKVETCIDDFDRRVRPAITGLRSQVIHNDLNLANILVTADAPDAVAGIIDFGDMVRAPLIMEPAIAAAYLRVSDSDAPALSLLIPLLQGFHSVEPLSADEFELLFDLVRARLATTISILSWRLAMRGAGDDYTRTYLGTESGAERYLRRLDALGRAEFQRHITNLLHNNDL